MKTRRFRILSCGLLVLAAASLWHVRVLAANGDPRLAPLDWTLGPGLFKVSAPDGFADDLVCRIVLSQADGRQLSWDLPVPRTGSGNGFIAPWPIAAADFSGLLNLDVVLSSAAAPGREFGHLVHSARRYHLPRALPALPSPPDVSGDLVMKVERSGVDVLSLHVTSQRTGSGWISRLHGPVPFLLRTVMQKEEVVVSSDMTTLGNGTVAPTAWSSRWKKGTVTVRYDLVTGAIARKTPFIQVAPQSAYDYVSMIQCLRRLAPSLEAPVLFLLDRYSAKEIMMDEEYWYIDASGNKQPVVALVFRPDQPRNEHAGGDVRRIRIGRLTDARNVKDFPEMYLDFDSRGAPLHFDLGAFDLTFQRATD
jgi:hypothetical protein